MAFIELAVAGSAITKLRWSLENSILKTLASPETVTVKGRIQVAQLDVDRATEY